MKYVGIDVGARRFHLTWFSDDDLAIQKAICRSPQGVPECIDGMDAIIAIDAPSDTRQVEHVKRLCEHELCIGGYFATPFNRDEAPGWMKSGFSLWDLLTEGGFCRATAFPTHEGHLIEVHPTLIFKRLFNPHVEPRLWILQQQPASKGTPVGKTQRKEKLNRLFQGQEDTINNLGIDHIDALIAAYAAKQSLRGNVQVFGNPEEGHIWVPN